MVNTSDIFSIAELYLLAAAFDAEVLFGLPDKKLYQLKGETIFEEAHQRLIEKEILTSEGKITDGGAFVIHALELYHQSRKYVRINNLMFAFREETEDELIMLVEVEEGKQYRLYVISKAIVLQLLGERFPVVFREPLENEKTFLQKELGQDERNEIESFSPDEPILNLECFQIKEDELTRLNTTKQQQWLVFVKDDKLFMVDTDNKRYYHASQYWFLKVLFHEMEFPYKGGYVK